MYNYTELTFTELVDKILKSRFWDLPKMVGEALKRLTPQAPKYKVYTALLTQSGTNAPVATVLENTLGGSIVWTRGEASGIYFATLSNVFTENKTFIQCNNTFDGTVRVIPAMELSSQPNTLVIYNRQMSDNDFTDNIDSAQIEIRVYN